MRSTKQQVEKVRKASEEIQEITEAIKTNFYGKPFSSRLTQPKAEWLILKQAHEKLLEYLHLTRKIK